MTRAHSNPRPSTIITDFRADRIAYAAGWSGMRLEAAGDILVTNVRQSFGGQQTPRNKETLRGSQDSTNIQLEIGKNKLNQSNNCKSSQVLAQLQCCS